MVEERIERRLLFDFFIHEAENLHNRVDWFLIFHGILFEAFLAARRPVHCITLGVLGCLVSYVWLVAGVRQWWNVRHLIDSLSDREIMGNTASNVVAGVFQARRNFRPSPTRWAHATPAFSVVLPLAVLLTWCVLTITYSEQGFSRVALVALSTAILLISWLWAYLPSSFVGRS